MSIKRKLSALSRIAIVVVIVVIIIIAGAAGYYALTVSKGTGTTSLPSTTSQSTTATGSITTTSSSSGVVSTSSSSSAGTGNKSSLTIGTNYVVDTLDNGYATGFADAELDHQINPGLVKFAYGTANVVGDAATNWTVSSDGLTYTFNLNPNVKFNNGDPVNASTWVYSLDRNFQLGSAFFWMRPYFGEPPVKEPNVTATGAYTLAMTLAHPYAGFLSVLATGQVYEPFDPSQVNGSEFTGANIISAGPYYVTNWVPNVELDLKANPYYFGTPPATPNIVIKYYATTTSLVLAAQSGDVDLVFGSLSPEEVSLASSATNFNLTQTQTPVPFMVGLNQKTSPLGNLTARQALAYLTNRTQIVNTVYNGFASPLYSIVPSGVLGSTTSFETDYGAQGNSTAAQNLLTALGYTKSNPMQLTLWYSSGDATQAATAAVLAQDWESTGQIVVNLETTDPTTLESYTVVNSTRVQAWITDINPPFFDPDVFLSFFVSSQYRSTYNGGTNWQNATVDGLINQERVSTNSTLRAQLAGQVQDMVASQVVFLPYIQQFQQVEANKNVHGIVLGGTTLLYLFLLYEPGSS